MVETHSHEFLFDGSVESQTFTIPSAPPEARNDAVGESVPVIPSVDHFEGALQTKQNHKE
jgi:hypothetical protein